MQRTRRQYSTTSPPKARRLGRRRSLAGKVTYVGSLRGYGDFLVIRHNSDYISVYAHTSKILVKKDQVVGKGQKIAEVGSSDADQPNAFFFESSALLNSGVSVQ